MPYTFSKSVIGIYIMLSFCIIFPDVSFLVPLIVISSESKLIAATFVSYVVII